MASQPLFDDPLFELAPPRWGPYERANPWRRVYLKVVDLDGDGITDLAGVKGGSVFIAWGQGDGTYASPVQTEPFNRILTGIALGDLNNDGMPDLIMGSTGATLSLLLGQEDRSFEALEGPSSKKRIFSLDTGDFDEDGLLDVAHVRTAGNTIFIHPGNGDGTFRPYSSFEVAWEPQSLLVADLNGDGHDDIAVASRSTGLVDWIPALSILLGHGDGTFAEAVLYPFESFFFDPMDLVGGDFDGDGDTDLVAVSSWRDQGIIAPAQAFRNRGDGTFETARLLDPVIPEDGGGAPAVGDFDGDGLDDLALCTHTHSAGHVALYFGDFNSLLVSTEALELNARPLTECEAADMDNDGDLDLAVVDRYGYAFVLSNDGNGKFAIPGPGNTIVDVSPWDIVAAQLTGDSIPDLAIAEWNGVAVFPGIGDGTFGEARRVEIVAENGLQAITAGHLDSDGIEDLAVTFWSAGEVLVLHGSMDGTPIPGPVLAVGLRIADIALAPVDDDASIDIAVADSVTDTVNLFLNDGEGNFTGGGTIPVGTTPTTLLAADLDGDGHTDLVTGNADGNRSLTDLDDLSVVFGTGAGFYAQEIRLTTGNEPFSLATGDMDGNGLLDLITSPGHRLSDTTVWLGAPGQDFASAPSITGFVRSHIAVDDMNSDGIPDLILASKVTRRLQILLGVGNGTFVPEFVYAFGSNGRFDTADFDVDGRQDLAITGNEEVIMMLNRGPFPAVRVPVELATRLPESGSHLRIRGVIVVRIRSTRDVDVSQVVPATIRLGGAPARRAGNSGEFLCQAIPVAGESRTDLRCEVEAAAITWEPDGSVLLEADLENGTHIKGKTTLDSP